MEPIWRKNLTRLMDLRGVKKKHIGPLAGMNERLGYDLYNPDANPQIKTLEAVARIFGVNVIELISDEATYTQRIPIVGAVSAGETWVAANDHLGELEMSIPGGEAIAVEVRGDSMRNYYRNGDVLIGMKCFAGNVAPLVGLDCIVETEDGGRYVKFLQASPMRGRFNLRSHNAEWPDIQAAKVVWAAPVQWIKRHQGKERPTRPVQ